MTTFNTEWMRAAWEQCKQGENPYCAQASETTLWAWEKTGAKDIWDLAGNSQFGVFAQAGLVVASAAIIYNIGKQVFGRNESDEKLKKALLKTKIENDILKQMYQQQLYRGLAQDPRWSAVTAPEA